MGFSFLVQAILESALPETDWSHLVASLGYTIGFVFVILGRQQLFTESTLTAVLPVLTRRDMETVGKTLRLWVIVLIFNLIGTTIFAALLQIPGVFSPEVTEALGKVAKVPYSGTFGVTVARALFAGWLIALMVWLLPSARSARLLTILLVTYTVAVSKLARHRGIGGSGLRRDVRRGERIRLFRRVPRADAHRQYPRRRVARRDRQSRGHRAGNQRVGAAQSAD